MAPRWKLYWALVAATAAVYLAMVAWSLPRLSALTGGLIPFDLRPGGYSHAEARALLAALGPEGARFYLEVQQALDTAFPAMIAAVLGIGLFRMTRGWPPLARMIAAALPLWGGVFDYLENAAVAAMLRAGPEALTAELTATASGWTMAKSAAIAAASLLLLGLLILASLRRRRVVGGGA